MKLAPPVAEALRQGAITLQAAQTFTLGEAPAQEKHLKRMQSDRTSGWAHSVDTIRREMTEKRVPLARALFDPALYQGEIVTDPATDDRYFADVEQVNRLNDEAIEAKLAALQKEWPWAKRLGAHEQYWQFNDARKGDKEAGAILYLNHQGQLQVKAPVLTPAIAKSRAAREAAKEREKTKAERAREREKEKKRAATVQALRLKLAVREDLCLPLLVLEKLDQYSLEVSDSARLELMLGPVAKLLRKAWSRKAGDKLFVQGYRSLEEKAELAVFNGLVALGGEVLARILCVMVADNAGLDDYDQAPLMRRLASALKGDATPEPEPEAAATEPDDEAGEEQLEIEDAIDQAATPPHFNAWWRVSGEPGVDPYADQIGLSRGYDSDNQVILEFPDGTVAHFSPHQLFPAEAPQPPAEEAAQ